MADMVTVPPPAPPPAPTLGGLAAIAKWAIDNQPTEWQTPLPAVRLAKPPDPDALLWFRIQAMYAPTYVTDPRAVLRNVTPV